MNKNGWSTEVPVPEDYAGWYWRAVGDESCVEPILVVQWDGKPHEVVVGENRYEPLKEEAEVWYLPLSAPPGPWS